MSFVLGFLLVAPETQSHSASHDEQARPVVLYDLQTRTASHLPQSHPAGHDARMGRLIPSGSPTRVASRIQSRLALHNGNTKPSATPEPLHPRASAGKFAVLIVSAAAKPVASRGRTPMSPREARRHLEQAYRFVISQPPKSQTLSLMLAQWALETGRGRYMWGFNFGGIKARTGGAVFDTRESFGTSAQRCAHRFRVYSSALEGATHYVRTLRLEFPKAFLALQGGSPAEFVRALAEERYFTGDPVEYVQAISLLAQSYQRQWLAQTSSESDAA